MKILHIAPQNVAGVPITFVRAEREMGHTSRLITMSRDPRGYEEDICLDLPLFRSPVVRVTKALLTPRERRTVVHRQRHYRRLPPVWRPNLLERPLFRLREMLWAPRVERVLAEIDAESFEIVQLDGGLDFFRDGRVVRRLKAAGAKIVCCYTGSDLRTRGIVPAVDSLCDTHVTVEFDHLALYPGIVHVFFPFEPDRMPPRRVIRDGRIRIGHAPSVRRAKGTGQILAAFREVQRRRPLVEIVLIENLPHREALRRKATCDIFVDQIGDLGYGINALEALAMGIPTATCLAPGFAERYPDHPFVEINEDNLVPALLELVDRRDLRAELASRGRAWLLKMHEASRVVERIHDALGKPR